MFGLVVSSLLVSGLMLVYSSKSLVDQFWNVILLATLTTLVPYAFAAAAHLILMIREPDRFTGRSLVRDAVIALLGFGYAFWAMVGSGEKTIAWGFLLLMAGIPVYVLMRWRQHADVERQHAAELERMGVDHAWRRRRTTSPAIAGSDAMKRGRPCRKPMQLTTSEEGSEETMKRVLIMGAAGRDFHNFNVVFRDDREVEVVAFTATQIPFIDERRYPAELAGPGYPLGIPIYPEERLEELIRDLKVDEVVFSYSDVSHEYVMHRASAGAGGRRELRAARAGCDHAAGERPGHRGVRGPDRRRQEPDHAGDRRDRSRSGGCVPSWCGTRCRTATWSPSGSSGSPRWMIWTPRA